jgi:hypothetical protein
MTRRPSIIAAAALAVFGLIAFAPTANALTTKTKACVKAARAKLKSSQAECRNTARSEYSTDFTSCFGPGAECASGCMSDQSSCIADVNASVAGARDNCKAAFETDLDNCRDDLDPTACASTARLTQFASNQAVAASLAGPLDSCNVEFSECTAACASAR